MSIEVNGVTLPDIPSDVLEQYPYVIVNAYPSGFLYQYCVIASDAKTIFLPKEIVGEDIWNTHGASAAYAYYYVGGETSWPDNGHYVEGGVGNNPDECPIVWSNHDVYTATAFDADTGVVTVGTEIYFPSSVSHPSEYSIPHDDVVFLADQTRRLTGATGSMGFQDIKDGLESVELGGTSLAENERIYQVGTAASTLDLSGLLFESLCTGGVNLYTYNCAETSSGTSLTTSVGCGAGDLVIAAIVTRDTLTLSDGWTLISTSGVNSSDTAGNGQRLSFAYKYATSESESITVTQASAQRLYINLVALQGATGYVDNGYSYENTEAISITVTKPDGLVLWACSAPLWASSSPYPIWTVSNDSTVLSLGTSTQSRLAVVLDESSDASVTFTSGSSTTTMIIGSLTITGMNGFTG